MIILPDKNIPRTKLLLPIADREWRTPSQAQPKDYFGNENRTHYRITARLNDGFPVWRGWFADRNDADAFLYAIVTGTLQYERELWRLPTPWWHPDIGEQLTYDFASVSYLTTTGSNQTWTSPTDWNNSNNKIELIGGGASGAVANGISRRVSGGGGAAYSKIITFSVATPGTTTATYRVGSGGASITGVGNNATSVGNAGTVTYFNASSDPGAGTDNTKAGAQPGVGGAVGGSGAGVTGSAGGVSTSGWGSTRYSGGRAGTLTGTSGVVASSGGGAAGPSGNGGDGGDSASTSSFVGVGTSGTADNGTVSGVASPSSSAGNAGTEFNDGLGNIKGVGSGGPANGNAAGATAGAGGTYGGGGGAVVVDSGNSNTSGAGIQGLIVVTYTPAVNGNFFMFFG